MATLPNRDHIVLPVTVQQFLQALADQYDVLSESIGAVGGTVATQSLLLADGTEAVPALRFSNDTDTGIYRISGNRLGFVVGGQLAAEILPSGKLVVPAGIESPLLTRALNNALGLGPRPVTVQDGDVVTFTARAAKQVAINRVEAESMANDLTGQVGYGEWAGTTGGTGGSVYWVDDVRDSRFGDPPPGTFRWAVNQVAASGQPGIVAFDVRRFMDILLEWEIEVPPNCTIDAPGRNVRLLAPTDVSILRIRAENIIIRRLQFSHVMGAATSTVRDAINVDPVLADRLVFRELSFERIADGCIDALTTADVTSPCRFTVQNCRGVDTDKFSLFGTNVCFQADPPAWCPVARDQGLQVFATYYQNVYDHCSQRHPSVVTKAYCDSVNNVFRLHQKTLDDGTFVGAYGVRGATGGHVLSRGDLFVRAEGPTNLSGAFAVTSPWVFPSTHGPGRCRIVGSVDAPGMVSTEEEPGLVPDPPYSLAAAPITNTVEGRAAFFETIYAAAGAEPDAAPDGVFQFVAAATEEPNGTTVLALQHDIPGRFKRHEPKPAAPAFKPWGVLELGKSVFLSNAEVFRLDDVTGVTRVRIPAVPRVGGSPVITAGSVTLTGGFHTIAPETGNEDDLDEILYAAGMVSGQQVAIVPGSVSHTIHVRSGQGNILLPGGLTITLVGTWREALMLRWTDSGNVWHLASKA